MPNNRGHFETIGLLFGTL